MSDIGDVLVGGVFTVIAVVVAFVLALWQDRIRERREDEKSKQTLMELIEGELNEIALYLQRAQFDTSLPIY